MVEADALTQQLERAADGGYDYARTKGLCDRAQTMLTIYRDIFAEITAKAIGVTAPDSDDPERIRHYVIPVGPIHRAAGKLGFQMFDGERYLAAFRDALAEYDRAMREEVIPAIEADQRRDALAAARARLWPLLSGGDAKLSPASGLDEATRNEV